MIKKKISIASTFSQQMLLKEETYIGGHLKTHTFIPPCVSAGFGHSGVP